jgi:hypothetical protein
MAFDLATAKPVEEKSSKGGFDLSTATPVTETGGGAALVTPKQRATPSTEEAKERVRSLSERMGEYLFGEPEREEISGSEIAGATGYGTVAGVGAPKAMRLLGKGLKVIPTAPTRAAGTFLETAGQLAGKVPVARRAFGGAVAGATGSTAEQTAEVLGAPKVISIPAGFATGAITPELEKAIEKLVVKAGSVVFGTQGMTSAIMQDLASQGVKVAPKVAELIEKKVNEFRQAPKGKTPQEALYGALKTGTTDITETAAQAARQAEGKGVAAMTEAERRAEKMGTAAERTKDISEKALADAKQARSSIGSPRDESTIGSTLRDKIVNLYGDIAGKRSSDYLAQKKIRDDIVNQKEAAGQLVAATQEYKDLLGDLRNKLLIGAKAQEQKTAPVTEKGVLDAYRNIYDAVSARRVAIAFDDAGKPTAFKTFPTSFEALDDVRRRLGDVAFGKEVEGYTAIGKNIAEQYYKKISEIQSKFAGESHDALQSNYEMASRLIDKFKSKAGQKATAIDRFDPARFSTDPASLPRDYFFSKQSVQDLLDLTGNDKAFVVKEASDFAARQLGASSRQTAKAAKDWAYKNESWLNELPEVKAKVSSYVAGLERAERIADKSKKAAAQLVPMERATIREGERALDAARAAGEKITKEAEQRVKTILGSQFPNEEIEKLMLSGDLGRWAEVAPILARSEVGKANMEQAVRQVMSRVSPKSMGDVFRDNVRQRLETTRLVPADKLDQMQDDLDYISSLTISPEQKMSMLQKLTRNLFAVVPGTTLGAPVGAKVGEIMEEE